MRTGEVVSVVEDKGFGFIKQATGGPDVFFHGSTLTGDFNGLAVGQAVQYELDDSSEKPRARAVVISGERVAKSSVGHAVSRGKSAGRPPGKSFGRPGGKFGDKPSRAGRDSGSGRPGAAPSGRPTGGRSAASRAPSGRVRDEIPGPVRKNVEYGFITKLRQDEQHGFISANNGGPELVFDAASVFGAKPFMLMNVGDYVRYERTAATRLLTQGLPQVPVASLVELTERRAPKPGPELPPNPRARRKKPTWR